MTIGSLFAGIGGLELGLERAGLGPVLWQVEQDAFCRRVLAKHWPDADRSVTDVCEAGRNSLEPVDIMCGGFPCQDLSYAGKGAGLAGARSGLWVEFARIIGELGPQVVVVENVPALFTRGIDVVLGSLAEIGYDSFWTTLQAADVGAPHKRERVFIVAYVRRFGEQRRRRPRNMAGETRSAEGEVRERQRVRDTAGNRNEALAYANRGRQQGERVGGLLHGERQARRHDADRRGGAMDLANAACKLRQRSGASRGGWDESTDAGTRQTQRELGRDPDGVPAGLDQYRWPAPPQEAQYEWEAPRTIPPENQDGFRAKRLKALGNAVVPQCAEVVGWLVKELMEEA